MGVAKSTSAVQVFTNFAGLDAIVKTAKKRTITQKAVKAGAKPVAAAAKAGARRESGALKQSIGIKAGKGKKGLTLAFAVIGARTKTEKVFKGRKRKPSHYAHLVEKGTKPHSLGKRARKGALHAAKVKLGIGRKHPGAKAHPFLKPALDRNREAAGKIIMEVMGTEIAKELAKVAAKSNAKG
jgi:HK97 gp10 family phage protein